MQYSYTDLVERLRSGVVTVTFKKIDDSERVMQCTLLPQYLPEDFRAKPPMLTETTGNSLSVWDVQAGGWRSFRIDSVISVS